MEDPWLHLWNERYSQEEFAFGEEPNVYLQENLEKFPARKILFGAEGEGRNAVFAARLGWNVSAFDISIAGKNKALKLATKNNVTVDYRVGELPSLGYQKDQFDAVALIYAHFPPGIRSSYHHLLHTYLRQNGIIILEAFSKNHLPYRLQNEKIGGPSNLESLFSIEELQLDFENYEIMELVEKEVELQEGLYHNGKGCVVRFVGRKKIVNG